MNDILHIVTVHEVVIVRPFNQLQDVGKRRRRSGNTRLCILHYLTVEWENMESVAYLLVLLWLVDHYFEVIVSSIALYKTLQCCSIKDVTLPISVGHSTAALGHITLCAAFHKTPARRLHFLNHC